jgi:hypothetical protein
VLHVPKGWKASEESYKRHQRHRHGEDDDVACECHGESRPIVLGQMRYILETKGEIKPEHVQIAFHARCDDAFSTACRKGKRCQETPRERM